MFFVTVVSLSAAAAVAVQQPTFKSRIDLVNVAVTVADRKGNLVTGLTAAQLNALTITPPADYSGSFNLTITATSTEAATVAGGGELQDADNTATTSQSFTVTVRDTIGQVATGFTGTVYFSSTDQQAGLGAVHGSSSFPVTSGAAAT